MSLIQLFEPVSCTFTYIIYDESSRDAVIIDPVDSQLDRDLAQLQAHQLHLNWVIETHAHADHITSAGRLAEHTGAKTAAPDQCGIRSATQRLQDNDELHFGSQTIRAIHTPGHTAGSMSFVWQNAVFTGDALLINGCGRTDFQSGSAEQQFHSITQKLFTLPDHTIVYPGHDYKGQLQSTIGHEKAHNPRLAGKSLAQFCQIMSDLNLPKPNMIDQAVPANLHLGIRHDDSGTNQSLAQGYAGDIEPLVAYQWWQDDRASLIDVRTDAEREWVGFVPNAGVAAWKLSPEMQANEQFSAQLLAQAPKNKPVLFLCRSGVRSIAAAQAATLLGYEAYNIVGGFEGELDENAQRKHINGWCIAHLPWRQC